MPPFPGCASKAGEFRLLAIRPRDRFTSPHRGEVDLRGKSGEGAPLQCETVTPHPALRADLSQWER